MELLFIQTKNIEEKIETRVKSICVHMKILVSAAINKRILWASVQLDMKVFFVKHAFKIFTKSPRSSVSNVLVNLKILQCRKKWTECRAPALAGTRQ